MRAQAGRFFLDLKSYNWQNIIIVALAGFYITDIGFRVVIYSFPDYGEDYLAYWSVGKIAEEEGYSKIYDLKILRSVETQELSRLNWIDQNKGSSFLTIPAPYLAVFLIPFQLLAHFRIQSSLTIWLIANLFILVGYSFYFTKEVWKIKNIKAPRSMPLVLVLFSYPVFENFAHGQINVFLMVCMGEFLRNSILGRRFSAGLWLGGLLLKPQLLVLIAPLLLFLGYWKPLKGLLLSSIAILLSSWLLSGSSGIKALFAILTQFTTEMGIVAPQLMINWRMVGINLNIWTNSTYGWIVTSLGMVTTLIAVIFLAKRKPDFGSIGWEVLMLGTFSATLAFTWHAHNFMAIIMIPLLIITFYSGMLSKKNLFFWVLLPPLAWIGAGLIEVIFQNLLQTKDISLIVVAIPFAAFFVNLYILCTVLLQKNVNKSAMKQSLWNPKKVVS